MSRLKIWDMLALLPMEFDGEHVTELAIWNDSVTVLKTSSMMYVHETQITEIVLRCPWLLGGRL